MTDRVWLGSEGVGEDGRGRMFQTSASRQLRLSLRGNGIDLESKGEGKWETRWYNFLRYRKRYCTFCYA